MNNIKVTFTHANSKLPEKQHTTDIGYDLTVASINKIKENIYEINFGIAVEPPKGYYLQLYPRSSIYKHDCIMTNGVGIIDPDYRGTISMVVKCTTPNKLPKVGDRFGQIVLVKSIESNIIHCHTLKDTKRGKGGFGSTGTTSSQQIITPTIHHQVYPIEEDTIEIL